MTNVFAVVGEHRDEPSRLLLLGDDGNSYAYANAFGQPIVVEPTDEWSIDPDALRHEVDGNAGSGQDN